MADNMNGINITIGADTTKLSKAISDSKTQASSLEKILKEVNRGLKFDPSNLELLKTKQKAVANELEQTKKQLDLLKTAQKQYIASGGDLNSKSYLTLEKNIAQCQNAMGRLEKEQQNTNNAMKTATSVTGTLKSKISEQESTLNKLKKEYSEYALKEEASSKEAKKLASEISSLSKEMVQNKTKLSNASEAADKLDKSYEKAKQGGEKLTNGLSGMKVAIGNLISNGVQNLINKMSELSSSSVDAYNEQIVAEKKLETVMKQRMGANDKSIESIKKLTAEQQKQGIIGDELQISGAQQLATFLNTDGALKTLIPAMNNLAAQQKGVNTTSGDMVTYGNLMGKVMQGQTSALKRVGITFDESQEKILKFGTEEERASMLAEIITANVGNMNSELAKTDAGKAKQVENTFGDLKEMIGEGLTKALTNLKVKLNEFFNSEKGKKLIQDISDGITTLTNEVLPPLLDALKFILDNLNIIVPLIASIIAGVLTFKTVTAVMTAISVAQKLWTVATTETTIAQAGLNTVLLANPIGIVIAIIVALVTALVLLYTNCESFRDMINNLFSVIADFFANVGQFFADLVVKMAETLADITVKVVTFLADLVVKAVQGIAKFVVSLVNGIASLPEKIWNGLTKVVSKVADFVVDFAEKGVDASAEFLGNLIDGLASIPGDMAEIGVNIIKGLWNGIKNVKKWILSKISGFCDDVIGGIKGFFGIHSPSRLMDKVIGRNLVLGIANGIKNKGHEAVNSIKNVGKNILSEAQNINSLGSIGATIDSSIKNNDIGVRVSHSMQDNNNNISSSIKDGIKGIVINVNNDFDGVTSTVSKQMAYAGKRG